MAKQQKITLRNGEEISLSERELLFCEYYLGECDRNGTQSAIKAGYSQKTAAVISYENLIKPHIRKYLEDKTATLLEALGISHERLVKKLRDQAFPNLTDFVDDDWNLLAPSQIPKEFHSALDSVEKEEKILMQGDNDKLEGTVLNRKIKYKLKDNIKPLLTLCEMSGLIEKKTQLPPEGSQPQQVINLFQQINQYLGGK